MRLEVVTYVEAKFGLRIRDSKPSDTGPRGHSDPMDVGKSTLSRQAKEKAHRVRAMGASSAVEHIFKETAVHAKAQAISRMAKANRASHGFKSEPSFSGKGKSKESKGKSKGKSKGTKSANQGAKGLHKGKPSKAGLKS